MPRKVILDIDPGVDDALALCVALADPTLEVVAVTATGGAVGPAQATRNVQALIERIDPPRWPRIGAADPKQPLRTDARDLHGPEGLGGAKIPVAEKAHQHVSTKVIADEIRASPGEVLLITTGPMTNAAAVLTREPDAAESLWGLVALGGSVAVGGDVTPAAEFNVYCDPGSAREVFRAGAETTLVPLDATADLMFGYDLIELVQGHDSRTARLLAEILPGFFRTHHERYGIEGARLHAAVAVIVASHRVLGKHQPMHGDVEVSGELTQGATVFDRRTVPDEKPNLEVITEVDHGKVRQSLFDTLKRAC